jgi:hypothetical protein
MRLVRNAAVTLVVLAVLALLFGRIADNDSDAPARPVLGQGLTALSITTATKVRISPDGSRLAVAEAGQVAIVGINDGKIVMRAGRNVVDVAWMPGEPSRVLVVEGPIPTGLITTLDMTGAVDGVQRLNPPISFGDGNGLAADSRGTQAAVIATTRDAIGGKLHTDLAIVQLQTGAVRIYATPDRNEARPLFVDDDYVAVASQGDTGPARLDFVELSTGEVVPGQPITGGPFVRTVGGEVVVARRASQGATRLLAVDALTGDERDLHVTEPHRRVVAVDLQVTKCLVRVIDPGGGAHLALEGFAG